MNKRIWLCLLLLATLLTACSVDLATGPAASKSPAPAGGAGGSSTTALPWADLHLPGQMIFTQGMNQLVRLDLATGGMTTIFQAPKNSWISATAVSPDGQKIVMAYAPPPSTAVTSTVLSGYTLLYLLPADGSSQPQQLLPTSDPQEEYVTPLWSPDGRYLYYIHIVPTHASTGPRYQFTLERLLYPQGQPETLVQDVQWPRLSPDGSKLAYVSVIATSSANDLYLADAEGKNAQRLIRADTFLAVDAPLFSPDGNTLVFSAVGDYIPPPSSWLDRLLGVQTAWAHNIPSDWWRMPVGGGTPQRLTKVNDTGMYADFSPDGQYVAFVSNSGLYVMKPDGSGLVQIQGYGPTGTVTWLAAR